ncbi:MBL fold metallo-hydrolase [bacterium]|nr:MBL fold metallo-hydrolase [bacterium]
MNQLLEVHILDVGFGDTILVKLPNGRFILVDCHRYALLQQYLANKNIEIEEFELVVATHPHKDHIGGLETILSNYRVRAFWDSSFRHETPIYQNLLDKIDAHSEVRFSLPKVGYVMIQGDVQIRVLAPQPIHIADSSSDANNASIVIKLCYGTHRGRPFSVLFSGDAQLESWAQMLAHQQEICATVFKVPHHGGKRGCNFELIEKIIPLTSIVSTSPGKHPGIPDETILDYLKTHSRSRRFPFFRTDIHGNIVVFANGKRYWVETERANFNNENR